MSPLLYLLLLSFYDRSIAEICRSPECVQSSEYILSKMDLKADPCQDFYQYTCGNWANVTDIPEGKAYYYTAEEMSARNWAKLKFLLKEGNTFLNGTHSKALEKVLDFYKLCIDDSQINSKGVEQIVQFILDMSSWNVTSSYGITWSDDSWDFQTALTVNQAYGFSAFFKIGFGFRRKIFRFLSGRYVDPLALGSREKNLDFGVKVGELLGGDKMSVINEMTKIYDLHAQLSNRSDASYNETEMDISAFQKLLGGEINLILLKNRFGQHNFSEFKVLVENPEYFEGLYSLISNTPKSTLANYMVWNAILENIQYFPSQFLQAYNTLYLDERRKEKLGNKSREDQCLDLHNRNIILRVAFGAIFEEESAFSNEDKNKINTIIKEVQSAFQRELMILPWLDDHMRRWAVTKAAGIEDTIGYIDWIRDAKQVDKFCGELDISPGNFLESSLKIKRSIQRNRLDSEWNLQELSSLEFDANAAFYGEQFFIYLGILQKPVFSSEFPMSFNFGTLGYITGHEITHGFDHEGIFTEVNGTWSWWWKNQTSYEFFNAQMNCLLDQYSNYSIGNATFASRRSQRQIVADNGGIQAAFNGFKNWQKSQDCTPQQELPGIPFSQDQMFFIGLGQVYCEYMTPRYVEENTREGHFTELAGVFRSTGMVSNSDDFAKAFDCPRNTPMNPEAKCRIW